MARVEHHGRVTVSWRRRTRVGVGIAAAAVMPFVPSPQAKAEETEQSKPVWAVPCRVDPTIGQTCDSLVPASCPPPAGRFSNGTESTLCDVDAATDLCSPGRFAPSSAPCGLLAVDCAGASDPVADARCAIGDLDDCSEPGTFTPADTCGLTAPTRGECGTYSTEVDRLLCEDLGFEDCEPGRYGDPTQNVQCNLIEVDDCGPGTYADALQTAACEVGRIADCLPTDVTDRCIVDCPPGRHGVESRSGCVESCPSSDPYLDEPTNECTYACPDDERQYADPQTQTCVAACSNAYRPGPNGLECTNATCATNQWMAQGGCVTKQECTDLNGYTDDETRTCNGGCPSPREPDPATRSCVTPGG